MEFDHWLAFDFAFIAIAVVAALKLSSCKERHAVVVPLFLVPTLSILLIDLGAMLFAAVGYVFYLSYKADRMHNAPRWIKITLLLGALLCCTTGIEYILYYEGVLEVAGLYQLYSQGVAAIMLLLLFAFVFPNGIGADGFRQLFTDIRSKSYWSFCSGRDSGNNHLQKINKGDS